MAASGTVTSRRSTALLLVSLALIGLVVSACVESRLRYTPVPPTPTVTPSPAPEATATPIPVVTPTSAPASTPTPVPQPVATTNSGTFNLTVDFEGLSEENVIRSDTVVLRGSTAPDAIVSVNGVLVDVRSDGSFQISLALDDGPNLIDVVASDLLGNSASSSLTVISIPEGEI